MVSLHFRPIEFVSEIHRVLLVDKEFMTLLGKIVLNPLFLPLIFLLRDEGVFDAILSFFEQYELVLGQVLYFVGLIIEFQLILA